MKNLQWDKNNNNTNQHHKNLLEVLPSKYHRWEFCWVNYKVSKSVLYSKTLIDLISKYCLNFPNIVI